MNTDELQKAIMEIREDLREIKTKVNTDYSRIESHEAAIRAHENRLTVLETTRKVGWMAAGVVCSAIISLGTLGMAVLTYLTK